MKTFLLKWLLLVVSLTIYGCGIGSPVGMSDDEFVFERYRDEDTTELKTFLLAHHPVGSDLEPLVKRLEASGARCIRSIDKTHPMAISCGYRAQDILWQRTWTVLIDYQEKQGGWKIDKLNAWSQLQIL